MRLLHLSIEIVPFRIIYFALWIVMTYPCKNTIRIEYRHNDVIRDNLFYKTC